MPNIHYWLNAFLCLVAPYNVKISDSGGATIVTNSTTVNNGDSLVFDCTAAGGPANMYCWFKDNMLFDNEVNITSVEVTDGGLYECRVSNDAGNSTASVTINGGYSLLCLRCDVLLFVDL